MVSAPSNSWLFSWRRVFVFGAALLLITLLVEPSDVFAASAPHITSPTTDSGTVGVAYTYQITVRSQDYPISVWGATPIPPGLSFNSTTGLISGTPTAAGTYSIGLSATNGNGTGTQTLTLTINNVPIGLFVGLRLPDFQTPLGTGYTPRLMLQMGATDPTGSHPFNATLEIDVSGNGTVWVPYNHFVGLNDTATWISNAALPVRDASGTNGTPQAFSTAQLTAAQLPAVYMKADPRATRFGIFQMDTNPTTSSRIALSLWPSGSSTVQNGFGGAVSTSFPGPVEHAPNRFSGVAYYPGTFCINPANGLPDSPRDTAVTTYADNDAVIRPADAVYPGGATTTGASTPYYTTSTNYHPIILNRPFRSVAELGYAFRDLPWKTLDFFSDKSADAGLLDIFTTNDGAPVLDGNGNVVGMAPPTMTAGSVNLNTTQATDLQPVLAGTILNELDSTNTISSTGTTATAAPVIAANIVTSTSGTPMQSKAELVTRSGLPNAILPTASNDNQAVKARREVVARAVSSVSQTRVWNLVIDVVAQSGHFKPNAGSLQNDFVVEGEQHYWVHVAIDRFTGRVIDKTIETVNE